MSTPEDLTGSLKYIDDLDETNPPNTGQAPSYGDDHMRGIKNVLKNTFPSITGPVTTTQAELNALDGYTGNTADLNILSGADTAGVTSAELQYLNGVTSAIQTQLDGKVATDATLTALAGTLTAANKIPYATATDTAGELDFKDEDDMVSDSASAVASQQSVKAYVDAQVATAGGAWELIGTPWTPTAVSEKDFTWDESLYSQVKLIGEGIVPATDGVNFRLRLGHTGGTVFYTGSGDYGGTAENLAANSTQAHDSHIVLAYNSTSEDTIGSNNSEGISFELTITGLNSTRSPAIVRGHSAYLSDAGVFRGSQIFAITTDGTSDSNTCDAAKLYWSSGNYEAQGVIYLVGLKRS